MSNRDRGCRLVHLVSWVCLVGAAVVGIHLLLVLSQGGYSFTVAGLTVSSRRLTPAAMLLVALGAGAVMCWKGQLSRAIFWSHSGSVLFAVLFVLYLANGKTLMSGDTWPLRYLPISVLREGNFDLDEFPFLYLRGGRWACCFFTKGDVELPYYIERAGDHYVSLYPVAAAVLVTPLYLPSVLGGLRSDHNIFEYVEKFSAATIVALSAVILYFTLRRVTTVAMAFGIALIYALGTSSLSISSQALFQHGPSQLALSAALYGTVRSRAEGSWFWFTGFWLAFATICRPTDALIAGPLAAYLVWHQPRRALHLGLGGVPPIVFQLAYNYAYFGNPLHSSLGMGAAFWSTPVWQGLSGILFSPGRGLFIYSSIYIFSVWALALSWRRQGDMLLRSLSIGVVLVVLVYSKWVMWWGGNSYGPRLLADLAPVLAFSLYPAREWIARSRLTKTLFLVAVVCSVYAHVVGAFVDDGTWNNRMDIDRFPERVWIWTNNPLSNASIRLATGVGHAVGIAK